MSSGRAGGTPAAPPALPGVLRDALALLWGHAPAFIALGAALGVVPTVASLQVSSAILRDDGAADDVLPLQAVVAIAGPALAYLSGTALDVAVQVIALGRGRGVGTVLRLVARLLPVNLCCFAAGLAVASVVSDTQWGVVTTSLASWSIMLPVLVAERVRLRDLPRRSLALARRRPAPVIALFACDLALGWTTRGDAFGVEPAYPLSSAGSWAWAASWSATAYAGQIAADVAFAAIYLALRRDEGASLDAEVASAFD